MKKWILRNGLCRQTDKERDNSITGIKPRLELGMFPLTIGYRGAGATRRKVYVKIGGGE